jgi:5-methylcytosine-specific restriction enzyme subunit McrC
VSDTIELREYRPSRVELSEADLDWFLDTGRKRFSLTPIRGSDAWWLSPESTVGVMVLPSGRRVHCQPKAPVRNVFYMLATALDLRSPFMDQPVHFERIDELFDFLVEHLANLVDARLHAGLYRSYIDREENLRAVRGRILIGEDLRRNAVMRHRTYCQYSEFTWDVPENRVIRQTVFAMSRLVHRNNLQRRLAMLDRSLGEIDPTPLPLSVFDTFHYHRLNDDYRPIHRLCRLLLEGSSVSETAGGTGFRAFLLDMNLLFEQFLAVALAEALPPELTLLSQCVSHLDHDRWIQIRPDMSLLRAEQTVLIADAKYKLLESERTGHSDLYQMLAYCTAEGIGHGVLVYPKWERGGESTLRVRNSPIEISRLAIDLGGSIADVRGEVLRMALGLTTRTGHQIAAVSGPDITNG